MSRCINRDVYDFIVILLVVVIGVTLVSLIVISEVYLTIGANGSMGYQLTDLTMLFNLAVVMTIIANGYNIFNYIFPKC